MTTNKDNEHAHRPPWLSVGWSVPLLIVLVVVEFMIVGYAWAYESTMVPPGAFTVLGLGAWGGVLLLLEILKLPLASHIAVAKKWKFTCFLILFLLCFATWDTVKDMGTQALKMGVATSVELVMEADKLDATNQQRVAEIEAINSASIMSSQGEEALRNTTAKDTAQLEGQRDQIIAAYGKRIVNAEVVDVLSPVELAQKSHLEEERRRVREEAAAFIAATEDRLHNATRAYEEIVANNQHQQEALRGELGQATSVWSTECEQLQAAFAVQSEAYQQAVADTRKRMDQVQGRLTQAIKDHRDNDGWGYGLEGKINAERARADEELASLQTELDALGPAPVLTLPAAPSIEDIAVRTGSPVQSGPNLAAIESERLAASEVRDQRLAEIDGKIGAIVARALERGTVRETGDRSAAQIAQLRADRDRGLAEIDEQIQDRAERLRTDLVALEQAMLPTDESVSRVSQLQTKINNNTTKAELLRIEAEDIYANSNVANVGAWVGYFYPDYTKEEREAFVYGPIVMVIAALVAFLPAILLELTIASLLKSFRPVPPSRRSRRLRQLPWRMFKARMAKRLQQRLAALTVKADRAIAAAQAKAKDDIHQAQEQAESFVQEAQGKMNESKEELARQTVAYHGELQQTEFDAAEQILQIRSDTDREVLEARADSRVARSEAEAKVKAMKSSIVENQAKAKDAARAEVQSRLSELEAEAAVARKRAAVAEADAAATHEAERVKSTIIAGLRQDIESLAKQRINFTIQDQTVAPHRIAS